MSMEPLRMGDGLHRNSLVALAAVILGRCVRIGVLLSLGLGQVACPHRTVVEHNRVHLGQLHLGMSPQQVLDVMGQPWKTERYMYKDKPYMVLHYLTQEPAGPMPTAEDVTLVVLENNVLIGYGDYIRVLLLFLDIPL